MRIQTYNGMGQPDMVLEGDVTSTHVHLDDVWATVSIKTKDGAVLTGLFVKTGEINASRLAAE